MINTHLIRPIGELLCRNAAERGDQPAFRDDARTTDWITVERRTRNLAAQIRKAVPPGACVAICMSNSVEAVESYLAVARAGNPAAFLNHGAGDGELQFMLSDCGARLLITEAAQAERTAKLAHLPQVLAEDFDALAAEDADAPDDLALDDPAWILYTSGTTGRPKGVILTQRSCLWVVASCWSTALGIGPGEDIMTALPLFHSYALTLTVLAPVATGASERLASRFSPRQTIRALREEDITVLAGVPTMFHYLLQELGDDELGAKSLRASVSAGAILAAPLHRAFEERSGAPLLDGYGITETSTMVTMNWPTGSRPAGSCGLPVPGCAVRLVDSTGRDVPAGTEGELIVRGPQVMQGYHNRPDATEAVLIDGWYHSGDLARADESGYLTITGRIKELIIRGGENIYPAEVEGALAEHDAILDAAVIGMPDDALGETVLAFIVPERPVDDEELRAFMARDLASFKLPTRFVTVDEIPRTGSGKVMRAKLRDLVH